jgi:hypothetical protein
MKQTAVEWLVEKIQQANPTFKFDALIREAKAMEKEQMIEARATAPLLASIDKDDYIKEAEQYYNETYEKR